MVTHQRKPTTGKLDPDLVAASGMQANVDLAGFTFRKAIEFQPGLFDALSLPFDCKDLVSCAVLPQKVFPVTAFRRRTMHHGTVFFYHAAFLDGLGKGSGSGFGPGVDHDTTHILIQSVDGEDLSAQSVDQCGRNLCFRIQPHRLDTHRDLPVRIKNFHKGPLDVFLIVPQNIPRCKDCRKK